MMKTPIADFIDEYNQKNFHRLHMPGHKGQCFLGCESYDITEIEGADSLYEAEGIIAESEANAAKLFGSGKTLYSTEGSSQCIRGMLHLALLEWKSRFGKQTDKRPVVIAARNVHKAFVYAAALLDFDVLWLWPETVQDSICSCPVSAAALNTLLMQLDIPPAAVYVTSPDYLGNEQEIAEFAAVCHAHDTILAVDNAHGAYLHFLKEKRHPLDLGADICCDSAHKTLPVLTGGAYLHISRQAPKSFSQNAKQAMALFGSTSPSYLTLCSLDLCNAYLFEGYEQKLSQTCQKTAGLRAQLAKNGWKTEGTEPLKITVRMPDDMEGSQIAWRLRKQRIECEFSDPEFIVFMITPENTEEDLQKISEVLGINSSPYQEKGSVRPSGGERKLSIREAVFAQQELLPTEQCLGRICGSVTVSCPPAIPIAVPGEVISSEALRLLKHYHVETINVIRTDLLKN